MKTLLLVSAPRSSSTLLYRICLEMLPGLRGDWPGKSASYGGEYIAHTIYPQVTSQTDYVSSATKVLSLSDRLIKHAASPYPLLKSMRQDFCNSLFLERSPVDCAHRLLSRGWVGPISFPNTLEALDRSARCTAAFQTEFWEELKWNYAPYLVQGVLLAQELYRELATSSIRYCDFIYDSNVLYNCLSNMGYVTLKKNYIDDAFIAKREEALAIRHTEMWNRLQDIVANEQRNISMLVKGFKESNENLF